MQKSAIYAKNERTLLGKVFGIGVSWQNGILAELI